MRQFTSRSVQVAGIALGVVLAAAVGLRAQSDDRKDRAPGGGAPGAGGDMDAMMKQFMEKSKPNEHHKVLEMMAGEWNVETTMRMAPDAQE